MAKLDIPRYRHLAQDEDGLVWGYTKKPKPKEADWLGGECYKLIATGKENPNWRNTLIDLDVDDYEFDGGILRRIENDTTKN